MTKHVVQIVVYPFENQIADTRPWDLCGCVECEPGRLAWVKYFIDQHNRLLAERGEHKDEKRASEDDDELRSFERLGEGHTDHYIPRT